MVMNGTHQERATALTGLGFQLFEQGRWSEAEASFRAAAVLDVDDEDAWIGLGSALMQQARCAEAAIVFGTAAAIARSSGAWPTLLAAEALMESGDPARAGQALAWFDAIAASEQITSEQASVARGLRRRMERAS